MKRFFFIIPYAILFGLSLQAFNFKLDHPIAEDISRLMPVKMKAIKAEDSEGAIKKVIKEACKNGDSISIAGMQHSQGGQTLYPNGILLDMKHYDKILDLDVKKNTSRFKAEQPGLIYRNISTHMDLH